MDIEDAARAAERTARRIRDIPAETVEDISSKETRADDWTAFAEELRRGARA